jgi:ketosteroid isomerase-like protein
MNDKDLRAYSDAWNAHDIEQIMAYHTEDCIFETGGGREKYGSRYSGFADVRKRFIEVWTDLPDVRFENGTHFIAGDRGCSEWTFVGTRSDGTKLEVNGCDLFTFRDEKIYVKNSLLKNRA